MPPNKNTVNYMKTYLVTLILYNIKLFTKNYSSRKFLRKNV